MNKFYVTTPIYYINDVPHIGHAYTTIAADVLARYYREKLGNDNVFFLTGTDEHGQKIAEAAKKNGKTPKEFVDNLVPKFKDAWKNLNISNDEFFRTTNPEHEKLVQEIVVKLKEKGYIEKRSYEGLYCVACERYYKKEELIDGKCPDHKIALVLQKEENYFLLLSKIAKNFDLVNIIKNDKFKILPESRKNEILSKIALSIEDVSISRENVSWGIPFPGDETQTIYVWVDALLNYYTATKIYNRANFWPANLHIMAKDILWFHGVIWPCICLASDLSLPKEIFAHGFFTINNEKMSKTIGNVINPNDWVKKYGADAVRYYLLSAFSFGSDGNVSGTDLAEKYNNELANQLGNLVNRVVVMTKNYFGKSLISDNNIQEKSLKIDLKKFEKYIENFEFNKALNYIFDFVRKGNEFIEKAKPWELAKNSNQKEKLEYVLGNLTLSINSIREALMPFLPETCEKMQKQLKTLEAESLFPRIDK